MKSRLTASLIGILVMLGPGAVYAYSLFVQPLVAGFGWSTTSSVLPFALANLALSLGAVVGGYWQEHEEPRRIAFTGISLWGLGNIIAGLLVPTLGINWLFLAYGILGGFGCGLAYIVVLSSIIKWFPATHRGIGAGLATLGFGLGGCVYAVALQYRPTYAAIARDAQNMLTVGVRTQHQELSAHIMPIFILSGIIFFAIGIFALLLEEAPVDEWTQPVLDGRQTAPAEMLRTPQFYVQWTILFLNVIAGAIILSNAVPIVAELSGQSSVLAANGFIVVAAFIGLGHLFWGAISDRLGRKITFCVLFGLQAVVFFVVGSLHDAFSVYAAFSLVFFCYGGGFSAMPAYNADFFGTHRFGLNYGLMLTAWGLAAFCGSLFVSTIKDVTGSYAMALEPIGLILMVAIVFPFIGEHMSSPAPPPTQRPPQPPLPPPGQNIRHLPAPHH